MHGARMHGARMHGARMHGARMHGARDQHDPCGVGGGRIGGNGHLQCRDEPESSRTH
ncbi:hypothetical protein [Burkholderia alba]|uniref:hypothetical protein n=1 Tax=Burkholderia alba TaxID=2683677 RepID=UPI003899283F